MAVRRRTENRRMLIRECYMCGKIINTTASSPFMRQIANVNGKKQAIVYFCSESCKNKSYKHKFDGEAWKRKKQRESERKKREILSAEQRPDQREKESGVLGKSRRNA